MASGLLICSCTPLGEASPQPVQLLLDMKQQCGVVPGAGDAGLREAAESERVEDEGPEEAPTSQPTPRLKRQLPDPDE